MSIGDVIKHYNRVSADDYQPTRFSMGQEKIRDIIFHHIDEVAQKYEIMSDLLTKTAEILIQVEGKTQEQNNDIKLLLDKIADAIGE